MWDFVLDWVLQNVALSAVVGMSFVLLSFAAAISAAVGSFRVYLGVGAVLGGSAAFTALFENVKAWDAVFALATAAVFGGAAYLMASGIAWFVRRKREKRLRREKAWRQLQFTLPERENSFVRARLNTVLQNREQSMENAGVEQSMGVCTQFDYAKSLLSKLRAANLSATDRLQVEELGGLLALYGKKEHLQLSDLQVVNDGFSLLLKMAAKYAVSP